MQHMFSSFPIVMADDDQEDKLLVKHAFITLGKAELFGSVADGVALLEYLEECLKHGRALPSLILLDLNMPKMDGKAVLAKIRGHERLRHLPVTIYSTSNNEDEIHRCYQLGANCYLVKPFNFDQLVEEMEKLYNFWFNVVKLPNTFGV